MSEQFVVAAVVMTHDAGLHARPSVKFTKLAKTYASGIELATAADGPWIDAKSIVRVMATRVPVGATLYLRALGPDSAAAIDALAALLEHGLDEDPTDAATS